MNKKFHMLPILLAYKQHTKKVACKQKKKDQPEKPELQIMKHTTIILYFHIWSTKALYKKQSCPPAVTLDQS